MKVSELIEFLNTLDPEEHLCALVYTKSLFVDEEITITDEAWEKICAWFDENDFDDVFSSVQMAVVDFCD